MLAFLGGLDYNYANNGHSSSFLSFDQQEELLRREDDLKSGKIKTEPWECVKKRFVRE